MFSSIIAFIQTNFAVVATTTVVAAGVVGAGYVTTQYIQDTVNNNNSSSQSSTNPEDKANENANIGGNYGSIRCARGQRIVRGICR